MPRPAADGARPALSYRPEIDGLRALAVVPVALFHARVPGFAGGFVGVDVFFVISGYLITAILLRDSQRPHGLASFYERRARRIVPALLPVLAFALAAAWLVLIPSDFRRFAQALAATGLFASNFLFALRSDYFFGEEGFEPLIHTWSLAVEEQFYLVYPLLLLLLVARHGRTAVRRMIVGVLAVSLATALVLADGAPRFAFYLLPTRAWELMAGALCAVLPPVVHTRQWPGLAGIALIVAGMALIGPATPAPGALFVVPVLGAALIIRYASADTHAGRTLGARPLVLAGLVSYGFYLWHQALLAFVFYGYFAAPPAWAVGATLAAAAALAAASYRWIERPVRAGRILVSGRRLAAVCAGGLAIAAAVGIAGHLQIVEPRMAIEAARLDARYAGPETVERTVPATNALPFLLYGDSHARQYYPALVGRAGRGAMITGSGCLSLPGATNWPQGSASHAPCAAQYRSALALLGERRVPVMIWAQRWERELFRNADGQPLGPSAGQAADILRNQLAAVRRALPVTTRLILVGNAPTAWAAGPHMQGGLLRCRAYRDTVCPTSYPSGMAEGRAANRILRAFAEDTDGVDYIDAAAPLCSGGRCAIVSGGRLYYSDGSHLTPFAARLVVDRIATALHDVAQPSVTRAAK